MSKPEDTKDTGPDPEQPTIRFRQLCRVGATILALSEDGVVYEQEGNGDIPVGGIWRRLPTVTSTQLEVRACSYPGCDGFWEVVPGSSGSTRDDRCRAHIYKP